MSMVHCMSGIAFGCIVWCPSAFTCLPGLEGFPLGSSGFFHVFIPPPGFMTPTVGRDVPHTSSVVLSNPVLMLFQRSSVAPSATFADVLTCKTWKWLLIWGSLNFQILRWGVNLRLDFGGTSILMSHTRSWCCRATSSPGITFTSVTSLSMVLQKRMNVCGYVSWLVHDEIAVTFLEQVFQRSRSNASAYSRVLPPSTSGSSLPYPIPPCTSLYPVPARPTWPFQSPHGIINSDAGILAVTAHSWSKNKSLTSSLRSLWGAYTDRK